MMIGDLFKFISLSVLRYVLYEKSGAINRKTSVNGEDRY